MIAVIIFIVLFAMVSYIQVRGSYLEYQELGQKYVEVFNTNLIYRYSIMGINFIVLFSAIYFTNRGIKKGLKPFFEKEKKPMPKILNKSLALVISMGINFIVLFSAIYFTNRGIKKGLKPFFEKEKKPMPKILNKSLALVISLIVSAVMSGVMMQKIMLALANTSFGLTDPIFNLDIAYYIFQKPVIEMLVYYFLGIVVGLTVYMAVYYIIVFNRYFDGVDPNMLKESLFMKKLTRNALLIIIAVAIITVLNSQNLMLGKILTVVDPNMLKESLFMKKLTRNALLIIIAVAIITVLNSQNLMLGKILTVDGEIEITGAGITESTIKLWGYVIFAFVIIIFAYRALKYFKQRNTAKILKNLAVIPIYLVALFVVMVGFDLIFVRTNELDKEKKYLAENIENTKNAYNLNIEEANLEYSGTITEQEINENQFTLNNIPIVSKEAVLSTLKNNQTNTGYFTYRDANLAKYKVGDREELQFTLNNIPIVSKEAVLSTLKNNQTNTGYFTYRDANLAKYKVGDREELVYVSPREISNTGRTYSNKTYEYTHGMGEILTSASETTESGNVKYIQKDVSGKDEKVNIEEPRTYFNTGNEGIIATNTKNKQEYDYTDEFGNDKTSTYNGQAGLQLNFLDRLVLGIYKNDINLAFSSEITNESKILINRNIIQRAKKALPYLMYDENPYTVISDDGKIYWVLDAYTISSS